MKMVKYVDILAEQPRLGKIYLYTDGYIVRQLIYQKHRIFYYADEDIVHIVVVIHHSQNVHKKVEFLKKYYK